MPTTVHIPSKLLASAEKRARALGISRNRLIVRALERELSDTTAWSPGFIAMLREAGPSHRDMVDAMLDGIRRHRRSKRPPVL